MIGVTASASRQDSSFGPAFAQTRAVPASQNYSFDPILDLDYSPMRTYGPYFSCSFTVCLCCLPVAVIHMPHSFDKRAKGGPGNFARG
jgi:hypothetical protein